MCSFSEIIGPAVLEGILTVMERDWQLYNRLDGI